jgi:hypothetical protein
MIGYANNIYSSVINFFSDDVIKIATLLILAWTAIEANRARRTNDEANSMKLLPLLVIEFKSEFQTDNHVPSFIIKNIGQSTAFDVIIEDWILINEDFIKEWQVKLKLTGTNYLPIGEQQLAADIFENGVKNNNLKKLISFITSPDDADHNNEKLIKAKFRIRFRNVHGTRYYSELMTARDGTNIITSAKKLTLLRNLIILLNTKISNVFIRICVGAKRWKRKHYL